MDNKTKNKIINCITSFLYNEYKNHETIVKWGGDDWRWKRVYLKNVAFSLMNYALYGVCAMAPERQFAYLQWVAQRYQEPRVKYNGVLGINPEREEDMVGMELVLKKQLHDNKIDARATINQVIQIILSVCSR